MVKGKSFSPPTFIKTVVTPWAKISPLIYKIVADEWRKKMASRSRWSIFLRIPERLQVHANKNQAERYKKATVSMKTTDLPHWLHRHITFPKESTIAVRILIYCKIRELFTTLESSQR